jgi:hypothetical protein
MLEKNTFSHTAFADDGGDFTFIDGQINAVEDGAVPETLGNVFEFYKWCGHDWSTKGRK